MKDGIDPPSEPIHTYSKIETPPVLSICKKCGCTHGMVVEEMATGKTEPIDVCKDCMFFGTYQPITEQVRLTDEEVQNLDEEFIAEQMDKMVKYMMQKFIENWVMYGGEEEYKTDIPQEMHDQYEKAYAAASKQWEEAAIDQRFVEMDFVYKPEIMTAERWKNRLRIIARDLMESQRKFNNGK